MRKGFIIFLLLQPVAASAFGDFKPFSAAKTVAAQSPDIDFCKIGKIVAVMGDCGAKAKSLTAVSPKSCMDVLNPLQQALQALYPAAQVELYRDLSASQAQAALARRDVFGFILVGAGKPDGGFKLDSEGTVLYPEPESCPKQPVDFFAGFYSHSKYSKVSPAPAADKGQIISRFENPPPGKYVKGSWPKTCKTAAAWVYPTATFAGKMKPDYESFLKNMTEAKEAQMRKALKIACAQCGGQKGKNNPLSKICYPASRVCDTMLITGDDRPVIEDNFCKWLVPPEEPNYR